MKVKTFCLEYEFEYQPCKLVSLYLHACVYVCSKKIIFKIRIVCISMRFKKKQLTHTHTHSFLASVRNVQCTPCTFSYMCVCFQLKRIDSDCMQTMISISSNYCLLQYRIHIHITYCYTDSQSMLIIMSVYINKYVCMCVYILNTSVHSICDHHH